MPLFKLGTSGILAGQAEVSPDVSTLGLTKNLLRDFLSSLKGIIVFKRLALIISLIALLAAAGCQSYKYTKVKGERKRLVDAQTDQAVPHADVQVWVYSRKDMKVEETVRLVGDENGIINIPEQMAAGFKLTGTGVRSAPREQSYWIEAEGYLPLHFGIWVNNYWLLTKPGRTFRMQPESIKDQLPESLTYKPVFRILAEQPVFIPTTRIPGKGAIQLLGVMVYRPIMDELERSGSQKMIEEKLAGAKVRPVIDTKMGLFVDWPDYLMAHLELEDGTDVGAWAIANGLALADFRFEHDLSEEYQRLEDEAVKEGRGVWGILKKMGAGGN